MTGSSRFRDLPWVGEYGVSAVASALGELDGEARLVLALLFIEGLSEAEAAAALDRSVEHVRHLAGAAQRALAASATAPPDRRAA
jgi:DNA-directed RNA polymerase specialized sigma24 family protein